MDPLDQIRGLLPQSDDSEDFYETWDGLRKRITVLSDRAWEGRITWDLVERWLNNFDGRSGLGIEVERLHALYLLSQFLYLGSAEIRVLLRALYMDLFFVPLVQEMRSAHSATRDAQILGQSVFHALARTRFLGVGNPSESGVHLLYYFRQENGLSKEHFMDNVQILERVQRDNGVYERVLRYPQVERYIFVDDVCGSGETAIKYSKDFLEEVRDLNPKAQLSYYAIFATAEGMKNVREKSIFKENSGAVYELDETNMCLSDVSRYLKVVPEGIEPDSVRKVALHYGELLVPGHGGGYENSQMLIGFHHNTPDNTLPIIWMDTPNGSPIPWTPAFRRYPKFLGGTL